MNNTPDAPDQTDFLSLCIAGSASNPLLEAIQERASEVVLAVFRLAKISLVHALTNEAVTKIIKSTHDILASFSQSVGSEVIITFVSSDTIFVCGELLRASRSVYESAMELAAIFAKCNVSEIRIGPEVSPQDLYLFAEALAVSMSDPNQTDRLLSVQIPNVVAEKVDTNLSTRKEEEERSLPIRERTLKAYANALIVLREFYDSVAGGANVLPHQAKRIAQNLVMIAEESETHLMGMTTLAHARREDATRSVHAAILSVLVGRKITKDPVVLSRLALSALLADAGRVQVGGTGRRDKLIRLTEDEECAVPAHSATLAFVTGGIKPASVMRAISAFETTWMERDELLGPPYQGSHQTTMLAKVLRLVRGLIDLVAPRDTSEALAPFDALSELARQPWVDPHLLRILTEAVGFVPSGTVVELNGGEWGVVVGSSDEPNAGHMPKVRVVTDKRGTACEMTDPLDFGNPKSKAGNMTITRVVSPQEARFNVTKAFID
jgi:HD-GYP domain-containing protein (c-di-GMP phosphodiesterase class II)